MAQTPAQKSKVTLKTTGSEFRPVASAVPDRWLLWHSTSDSETSFGCLTPAFADMTGEGLQSACGGLP